MHKAFASRLLIGILLFSLSASCLAEARQGAPVRGLHLVLRGVAVDDVKRRIDLAAASGFNSLVMSLADGVAFASFPGDVRNDAWSIGELKDVVEYSRRRGIKVIPEIALLTHQEKFFQTRHRALMFNALTFDPRLEGTYKLSFAYLDEVIAALHPDVIHIGHDEVAGWNEAHARRKLGPGEKMLPSELFVESVQRVHAYLKGKGIATWMWGDMLVSPGEFPGMLGKHLHGVAPGYGRAVRMQLPKDIVICDGHYFDRQREFPSVEVLRKEGFRVIGATWKTPATISNFSAYAAKHGADGMIATTWWHVQKNEWEVVDDLIRASGEAFRKHFPDAE